CLASSQHPDGSTGVAWLSTPLRQQRDQRTGVVEPVVPLAAEIAAVEGELVAPVADGAVSGAQGEHGAELEVERVRVTKGQKEERHQRTPDLLDAVQRSPRLRPSGNVAAMACFVVHAVPRSPDRDATLMKSPFSSRISTSSSRLSPPLI